MRRDGQIECMTSRYTVNVFKICNCQLRQELKNRLRKVLWNRPLVNKSQNRRCRFACNFACKIACQLTCQDLASPNPDKAKSNPDMSADMQDIEMIV